MAEAFVTALEHLNPEHALQYYEHAYNMSALAVRRVLEEIMSSTDWPVYSPFAREHFGRGKLEGRAEGRVEGRLEGRAEEAANLILMVLSTRGLSVSDDARTRITRCADLDRLETWAERAVTVATADDLFG